MSNSLRQRLGNDPEPHLHPDADLLTAYAERRLSPAEQADMVRHLAACSYCREVVALSLPEVQVQPAAASTPARVTWWMPWGIPVMRWAAVAATLVVGATLVIEKPWKPSVFVPGPVKNDAVAESSKQAPVAPSADAGPAASGPSAQTGLASPQPQPTIAAKAAGAALGDEPAGRRDLASGRADLSNDKNLSATHSFAPRMEATRNSLPANYAGGPSRNTLSNNSYVDSAGTVANPSVVPAPSTAVTAQADLISAPAPKPGIAGQASETGFVVRQLPGLPITAENIANSRFAVSFGNEQKGEARQRASADTFATSRIFRVPAKIASAGKEKLGAAMSPRPGAGLALMEKAPPAQFAPAERVHWSISPEGKLIKSSDLSMWHEAYPQKDNLLFKVVVVEGHDVWAGGNHMTLIHSWNGGVDWKKLKLSDAATGDITDIQIGDGDVQVKTSNNQTFVSQDGGVTWVPLKQQPK